MPSVSTQMQTDETCELLLSNDFHDVHKRNSNKVKIYTSSIQTRGSWMSKGIKKCLFLLGFLIIFGGLSIVYLGYYCPDSSVCAFSSGTKNRYALPKTDIAINEFHLSNDHIGRPLGDSDRRETGPTFDDVTGKDFMFNIKGHDVIVFLHIQKTGGTTFGKHLVHDLDLERGCQCHRKVRKKCTCLRPGQNDAETWLFSRYSTGWACGLHADWTELTSCVDGIMDKIENHEIKRRYFYITFLRDPVHRFLSEYRHVRRGATWKMARLMCSDRPATKEEVPNCYTGETWENVTLKEFISCPHNLAFNRQTRMLADLTLVGCYNTSLMKKEERETTMLLSAKNNLRNMAFFGLTEEQEKSQYLFEETFNLKFQARFQQYEGTLADESLSKIPKDILNTIRKENHLDILLYEYARDLLKKRYNFLSMHDINFHEHFSNMGKLNFSWDDIENES